MLDRSTRIQRLADRVHWLDRYRRTLAICAAMVIAPLLISQAGDSLGADWPQLYAAILSLTVGVIAWWVVEVALVGVTALWETECHRLMRDRGLPRAIVHK